MNPSDKAPLSPADLAQLDALTGGVFSAPTSGERAARLRSWLATDPTQEALNDVYRELSHRDKGAAKPLKEKLDELRRAKTQDTLAAEWAAKAQALLAAPRLNLADAMAWQRDAAKAGAPLSREPLAGLKQALAERMKGLEELQHRVQVEREAAVLLAQRIEVLSTKPWQDAQAVVEALRQDVQGWQAHADQLGADALWDSLDPKFPAQLETSRQQLWLVWEAFDAALAQARAAAEDAQAPLPAVPVWADALRALRGEAPAPAVEADPAARAARETEARQAVGVSLEALRQALTDGQTRQIPRALAQLRQALKTHGRHVGAELEAQVQAALAQAGELEGWQRWRADQLREALVAKAVALTQAPEGQRLGGRKMQETLRSLREEWKATDQGGAPNHALWKTFDEACNQAHQLVEAWLDKIRQHNETTKAQRLALIAEVRDWTTAHANDQDWKGQLRALHGFAERWRAAGHLSEKGFAELQPQWKDTIHQAHARLESAQADSVARRQALIAEAQALAAAPAWRVDAVKALQQRWQQEAHAVPLDRKQEQKLWEAFRAPIDEAFARKDSQRAAQEAAVSDHDRAVLEAAQALNQASDSGDAARIRAAMAALQSALQAAPPAPATDTPAVAEAAADVATEAVPSPVAPAPAAPRKLVAMRGDDRPGAARPASPAARPSGRDAGRGPRDLRDRRDARPPRDDAPWTRGPRLGDAAFRAQRQALEQAEASLRKLAAQAHGEVLTQLLEAWARRDPAALPAASALGSRVPSAARQAWVQALSAAPTALADEALLRLEMAAEVPTPAEQLNARRALQLQLLTRRHDPAPAQTWPQDVARVLAAAHQPDLARRLQAVLKALLRR